MGVRSRRWLRSKGNILCFVGWSLRLAEKEEVMAKEAKKEVNGGKDGLGSVRLETKKDGCGMDVCISAICSGVAGV